MKKFILLIALAIMVLFATGCDQDTFITIDFSDMQDTTGWGADTVCWDSTGTKTVKCP